MVACFGPITAIGLLGLVIGGRWLSWVAGAAFGIGAGAWIAMRESPPAYIENWQTGAEGERKTERALRRLDRSDWFVVHDVQCRHGNYDHILVGPPGIFLLDSKNPRGIVHIRDGQPYLRRRSDPESDTPHRWLRSTALRGAASLHEEVRRHFSGGVWVQAVVVLWSQFDESLHEDDRCFFVHGTGLPEWLAGRPRRFDKAQTQELAKAVQAVAQAAAKSGLQHRAIRNASDS